MVVHIHTLCHNERALIPTVMKYWHFIASHVFVYLMKSSDDGSRELLNQYPDFITIIEIDDEDGFNDGRNMEIKNQVWKNSRGKADFVIVTDFDECVWSFDFQKELEYMALNNMTIATPRYWHLIQQEDVDLEQINESNKFLHEEIRGCLINEPKTVLFNPNKISDINYCPGAHRCSPQGDVKWYDGENIHTFHCKYLGFNSFIEKEQRLAKRLSETNKRCGWGYHYLLKFDWHKKTFEDTLNNSVKLSEILDKK